MQNSQNLGSAIKSLESLLVSPPQFQGLDFVVTNSWPDGDGGTASFKLECGIGVVNEDDYDPFEKEYEWSPKRGHMIRLSWTPGFLDKGEAESVANDLELTAREWCKGLHDFDGCDDDYPDFFDSVDFVPRSSESSIVFTFSEPVARNNKGYAA